MPFLFIEFTFKIASYVFNNLLRYIRANTDVKRQRYKRIDVPVIFPDILQQCVFHLCQPQTYIPLTCHPMRRKNWFVVVHMCHWYRSADTLH
jgi:hypothetical protein